jgi:hypothetical protein
VWVCAMAERDECKDESLTDALRDLAETGALIVDEIIDSLKPPDEDVRRMKRHFWQLQVKIANGLATLAETRLRNLKSDAPPRHADKIEVEED